MTAGGPLEGRKHEAQIKSKAKDVGGGPESM